ncbi:MAG: hypothetical protein KIH62_005025 [Candidatus Kerfeldbacteria bacterium]|nr:hypothetical protein [Candidatus Kerfeldbacteria bacterium]
MLTSDIKTVLWDIPQDQIKTLPQEFIIQRALTYGGVRLITQLMHQYGSSTVKTVLHNMKSGAITQKKQYYLEQYLLP